MDEGQLGLGIFVALFAALLIAAGVAALVAWWKNRRNDE